jgi:hypothetical protein
LFFRVLGLLFIRLWRRERRGRGCMWHGIFNVILRIKFRDIAGCNYIQKSLALSVDICYVLSVWNLIAVGFLGLLAALGGSKGG